MDQPTQQPIYDYVIAQLEAWKYRWQEVADRTGISKRTIEKIARKEIEAPNVHTIQRLADFFRGQQVAA